MRFFPLVLAAAWSVNAVLAQTGGARKEGAADAAWSHLVELEKGPAQKPKSREEATDYVQTLNQTAADFAKQYPGDPRAWGAKMVVVQSGAMLAGLGKDGYTAEQAMAAAKEIAEAKDAPKEIRQGAKLFLLSQASDPEAFKAELEKYQKEYPDDTRVDRLKFEYAQMLSEEDPDKAKAAFKELAQSKDSEVAEKAQRMVRLSEMLGKPLELKFTAVDGKEVDLSTMKGKVVLIDFWATWCGPCMMEVPNVVATYKANHDKGFDIVGISLDQSKEKLLAVTAEKGMTWPQYFDGAGWDNKFAQEFGVNSIPRMWLVNKKGELVDVNAREGLEEKVQKLLAE